MARNWKEVRKNLGPEREARIKRRVRDEIAHLSLIQLREARNLTQVRLAELLGIPKAGVSRLERRTDIYVSTLRNLHSRDGRRAQDYCGVSEWGSAISQFQDAEEQKNRRTEEQKNRRTEEQKNRRTVEAGRHAINRPSSLSLRHPPPITVNGKP